MSGSIPARAGQPEDQNHEATRIGVHPRSRGAATNLIHGVINGVGPSPLARGSQDAWRYEPAHRGSIPARAGQPASRSSTPPPRRVHPRSRGAARGLAVWRSKAPGPSPLARGSLANGHQTDRAAGSIPARAGQPVPRAPARRTSAVHPRSRGAATPCRLCQSRTRGPSPLARGSPKWCPTRTTRLWVHPRSRGAALAAVGGGVADLGPSPLARGSPVVRVLVHKVCGSIPRSRGAA